MTGRGSIAGKPTRRHWKAYALHTVLIAAGVLGSMVAQADMILQDNVMVTKPSAPKVEALGQSAPGRWTVTVTDLEWPQALQSLSFAITDLSGVLVTRSGPGTLIYDALSPGYLFATVYALPNAVSSMGLYHINVEFSPAAPPVPLPAAAWLLLSALCGVAGLRRKHATVTNSVVQ